MKIVYTFVYSSALIANVIECSSKGDRNPDMNCNPGPPSPGSNLLLLAEYCSQIEENLNSGNNPGSSSPSGKQHSSEQWHSETEPLRARSRSPASTPSPVKLLGYSLRQLGYIRLIPHTNQNLQFEFRRFVFPNGIQIRLRAEQGRYDPVPAGEHIVLSTSNGDVFAILKYSGSFRGMYSTNRSHPRMKMNMISSLIERMTPDEIRDSPLGKKYPIFPDSFSKSFADEDSLKSVWNPDSECEELSLGARFRSPPGRPPSKQVLGYSLRKLGYIRLIPQANPDRRFEFRRYFLPVDKPIRLRIERHSFPVPNREHVVLSTANGEVFAILECNGILRGIYRLSQNHPRVKINMMSGAVEDLSAMERKECHVGETYPIFPRWFSKDVSNEDSLQHVYH